MQTELYVNSILEVWQTDKDYSKEDVQPTLHRVLWLNRHLVVTIDIHDKNAQPEVVNRAEIENQIESLDIQITSYVIPRLSLPDHSLNKKEIQIRDKVWGYLEPAVTGNHVPDIYKKRLRGIIIEEIHERFKVSKTLIRNNIRKYWQRGMVINALLPDYPNCGNKGQERSGLGKKLGCPNNESKDDPELIGINVTEEIRKNFRKAIDLWYKKREKRSLFDVYELMLGKFYKAHIDEEDGITLLPEHERPTFRQFYYWYSKERNLVEELSKRVGTRRVNLKHRAIDGNFDKASFGPGSIYQIDATIGNIYLVNRKNRDWLIGRPVIYFVIDVFSRLIVGLYVGLEGPSWIGAALALENAASDKVEYCKHFGIDITKEEWPSFGLPEQLTTDRGEYVGNKPAHLIKTLNVKVEHLPPFRADWKPFVEKAFDLSDDLYVKWTPGGILERMKERGDYDTKDDRALDIHEFETILIECVRYHNKHYMQSYRRNDAMIEDDVTPTPVDLWHWGRKNSLGTLRYVSKDQLRMNLLPSRRARFTAGGIRFNKDLYTCVTAEDESWRFRARNGEKFNVEYSFDPRDTSRLFLRHPDGQFEECFKLEEQHSKHIQSSRVFRWEEELDVVAYEARQAKKGRSKNTEAKLRMIDKNNKTIEQAKRKTAAETQDQARRTRPEDVREHRAISKEEEREERAWRLEKDEPSGSNKSEKVVYLADRKSDKYVPRADHTDSILRAMEEDDDE
ncbi:DDE-type integrase/transposase/recombinase [Gorillibacterium massiliense]|uniref:DDE-type integrase/transposase/recombinase n=1 Tax=Gorillibacterium massiliense TaxID=1280390 RepID=UPI0004B32A84|nr:DDE-type integrase/transposase/recombinase [Gorillibacterium massiliense]